MHYCSQMAVFYCCGELKPVQSLWGGGMQLLGEIKSMSERFHPPLIVCSVNHASLQSDNFEEYLRILFL